jgi:hypothetical protein
MGARHAQVLRYDTEAAYGPNPMVERWDALRWRPLVLETRPRRSVALQITRKHARTGANKLRRKRLLTLAIRGDTDRQEKTLYQPVTAFCETQ